jgi:hypothetical protein
LQKILFVILNNDFDNVSFCKVTAALATARSVREADDRAKALTKVAIAMADAEKEVSVSK